MARDFNDKHPELLEGEVFLQNVIDPEHLKLDSSLAMFGGLDFASIPFSRKRLGRIAYDNHGKILPLARPVFVDRISFEMEEIADWGSVN